MAVHYFHNKKNTNKNKKKRTIFTTQANPASPCLYQASPAHLAMLRPQWLHKEPTQVVPGCLWPKSFQAVGPGLVGGLPRRDFLLLLGAALRPAMYHFQKVYFCGLPHRLCWKERTAPQRAHRETINAAKEVNDCRGMGTSSNNEQPVSLMKCFSVYKGQA